MNDGHRRAITGIILSGGKNQRMGENKAFLKIEGIPIIERICDLFSHLFQETIIVTNEPDSYVQFDAKIHADLLPNAGALGGLYTGLHYSSYPYSFAAACDMPYLKSPLITYLVGKKDGYDITIPRTGDGFQSLHAIYSKVCIGPMERLLKEKRAKILDLFPWVRVNVIGENEILPLDPGLESFINLNTPEDLVRYQGRNGPP